MDEEKVITMQPTEKDSNTTDTNSGNRLLDGNKVDVDITPTTDGNLVVVNLCSCVLSCR